MLGIRRCIAGILSGSGTARCLTPVTVPPLHGVCGSCTRHGGQAPSVPVPDADQKEFTEPVALSSPRHIDLPLARSAFVTGFDLVALRARCTANLRRRESQVKQAAEEKSAICAVSFPEPGTVLDDGTPTTMPRCAADGRTCS